MFRFVEILFWFSICSLALFYLVYYSLMIYMANKSDITRKRTFFPKVSLVIPTFNEEKVIIQKLKNTYSLNYPKEKLEVLVVDSASTDNTCQMVQNFIQNSSGMKIQLVTQPQRSGKASALNLTWQYCHGEIVIMSDADVTLEESAITKIVRNFADRNVGAVTGSLSIVNFNQSFMAGVEKTYRNIFQTLRMGETRMDSTPIVNGPIVAFRREILDKLKLDTVTDDIELCLRVREKNHRCVYEPEAVAYERAPTTLKSRLKQKSRRGQGIIQAFIRHRKMMFNPKYGKYGFVILPSEFFMHIISPILVILVIISAVTMIALKPIIIKTFALLILILSAVAFLIMLVSRVVMQHRTGINPFVLLGTFFNDQVCLLIGLIPLFIGRTSHVWEKIEDVRSIST